MKTERMKGQAERAMKRRKRVVWNVGDIFIVPQKDGKYSVGQVIGREREALNSVTCAFYGIRLDEKPTGRVDLELPTRKVIAIHFVTPESLNFGMWIVVGHAEPANTEMFDDILGQLKRDGFVGATVTGSGIIREFLDAFFGLAPWDDWADPNYLDTLLISPDKKPKHLLYKPRS